MHTIVVVNIHSLFMYMYRDIIANSFFDLNSIVDIFNMYLILSI